MIYENILHLPEIGNFQEAINVRLALRTLICTYLMYVESYTDLKNLTPLVNYPPK